MSSLVHLFYLFQAHVRDVYCTLTDENGEDVKWDLSQK